MNNLNSEYYITNSSSFSAQSKPINIEIILNEKLVSRGKDIGPPYGKKFIFFIDDVNMPKMDKYGSQPVNEFLRQLLDQEGYYDLKKYQFKHVKSTNFILACTTGNDLTINISQRLIRHFFTIHLADMSKQSMHLIFNSILHQYYITEYKFTISTDKIKSLIESSINLYFKISEKLLPTPNKSHYSFNLRDLSKVYQGMTLKNIDIKNDKDIYDLFCHEISAQTGVLKANSRYLKYCDSYNVLLICTFISLK